MVNPAKPTIAINRFLTIITNFEKPLKSLWNVQYSIIAGNINPNADKHNAPNNEMNNSKFGMATASKTVGRRKRQRHREKEQRKKNNKRQFKINLELEVCG